MLYACPPCAQSFRISERVIHSCTDVCSNRPSHSVDILPSTSNGHTDPVNWIDIRLATAQRCKCAARFYRVCVVPGGILCIFCMEGFERHGHATPPVLMRTHTIAPKPENLAIVAKGLFTLAKGPAEYVIALLKYSGTLC